MFLCAFFAQCLSVCLTKESYLVPMHLVSRVQCCGDIKFLMKRCLVTRSRVLHFQTYRSASSTAFPGGRAVRRTPWGNPSYVTEQIRASAREFNPVSMSLPGGRIVRRTPWGMLTRVGMGIRAGRGQTFPRRPVSAVQSTGPVCLQSWRTRLARPVLWQRGGQARPQYLSTPTLWVQCA